MFDTELFERDPREYAQDLADAVGPEKVLLAALLYMSHDQVREMLDANEWSPRFCPPDEPYAWAVWQECGPVWGYGMTRQEAWSDAQQYTGHLHEDEVNVGRCTRRLYDAVESGGGDLRYVLTGDDILDLPED